MAAANTDKFKKVAVKFSTTVAAPGVAAADSTTAPLASASGLPTDTACNLTFNRVNSEGTVQATYETATGVVSGSNFTNMVRGVEGTASAWPAGTVVECLVTADVQNDMVDGILAQHTQAGAHGAITTTGITSTGDATFSDGKGIIGKTTGGASKTILALDTDVTYVGNAAQATVYRGTTHTVWDANGNEVIKTAAGTASAKNELTFTNAAASGAPVMSATGDDTNIGIKIATKGTGSMRIPVYEQAADGTNTMRQNQVIQRGWGFVVGDGDGACEKAVTFPVAFDDALVDIQVTYLGSLNGSNPATRAGGNTQFTAGIMMVKEGTVAAAGFTLQFKLASGSISSDYRNIYSWVAIGTKA